MSRLLVGACQCVTYTRGGCEHLGAPCPYNCKQYSSSTSGFGVPHLVTRGCSWRVWNNVWGSNTHPVVFLGPRFLTLRGGGRPSSIGTESEVEVAEGTGLGYREDSGSWGESRSWGTGRAFGWDGGSCEEPGDYVGRWEEESHWCKSEADSRTAPSFTSVLWSLLFAAGSTARSIELLGVNIRESFPGHAARGCHTW